MVDMPELLIQDLMLREDHKFLNDMISKLGLSQADTRSAYKKQFIAGMDSEPVEHKKNNAGRRRANLWLLEKTDPLRLPRQLRIHRSIEENE
jgi:hypothetical protein